MNKTKEIEELKTAERLFTFWLQNNGYILERTKDDSDSVYCFKNVLFASKAKICMIAFFSCTDYSSFVTISKGMREPEIIKVNEFINRMNKSLKK